MGPSLRRHYPTSQVIWPTPTPSLTAALSSDVRSRDPRQTRASPTRRRSPSSTCRAQYPGGPDQVLVGWRVARSRAGFFPVRAAFPSSGAGRRPHRYFRGLLKLHTRYGLQSCSPTIRRLCREAPPLPVSRLGRSPATKFNQQPPWVGPSPTGVLRRWGAPGNPTYRSLPCPRTDPRRPWLPKSWDGVLTVPKSPPLNRR